MLFKVSVELFFQLSRQTNSLLGASDEVLAADPNSVASKSPEQNMSLRMLLRIDGSYQNDLS
jgi:hypothetical protein